MAVDPNLNKEIPPGLPGRLSTIKSISEKTSQSKTSSVKSNFRPKISVNP